MEFTLEHSCRYVKDMERTLRFYKEALGLEPVRWMYPEDQDVELAFLSDGKSVHQIEIACLADRSIPYDPGDSDSHLAFSVEDYEAAHALHEKMGCIYRDPELAPVYFIKDPDGYQIEIIPRTDSLPGGPRRTKK